MLKKILFSGAALSGVLAFSAPANAVTYASGSTTASSPGGATPIIFFAAPDATTVDVTITDCCVGGDYYATYLDGAYIGTTPFVPQYGSTLSSATFVASLGITGGTHTLQLFDQTSFLLPAGLYYSVTSAVPETGTWALMLIGTFGLGGALRHRRKTSAAGQYA